MARRAYVTFGFALLSLAASAQSPPYEPWNWTLEERIAARFDARARAMRVAASKARAMSFPQMPAADSSGASTPAPSDVLDGRANPEVFFPTEVFEHFIWKAYTLESPVWRQSMRDQSRDILRTDAEWRDLDAIVAPYAASLRRDIELVESEDRANGPQRREIERERETLHESNCSLRRDAFRAARARFGKERFDRFLYSVALTGFASSYSADHDFTKDRERVLFIEEHCQ
jgi:hypothetical protein